MIKFKTVLATVKKMGSAESAKGGECGKYMVPGRRGNRDTSNWLLK
jgi:hypothetical protein